MNQLFERDGALCVFYYKRQLSETCLDWPAYNLHENMKSDYRYPVVKLSLNDQSP